MRKKESENKDEKPIRAAIRKMIEEHPDFVVDELLEHPIWLHKLDEKFLYQRQGDDPDGGYSCLQIAFPPDLAAHVSVTSQIDTEHTTSRYHRFRTQFDGGKSPLVRNGFTILARSIQLQNAKNPQKIPEPAQLEE